MNNKEKTAIMNVIRAAENPEIYGIKTVNSAESNKAIAKALKTLFDIDAKTGTIIDFNAETIDAFYRLTARPSIDIL